MTTTRSRASAYEPRSGAPLLEARAAAAHVGVSVAMLRAATAAGEVAHVRLRSRGSGAREAVRWLVEDLDAWVLAHRVPATPRASAAVVERRGSPPHPFAVAIRPRAEGMRGGAGPLLSAREVLRESGAS